SQDENNEISSATKISTLVETSNLSNLNNVLENNLEHENQDEIFYSKCDLSCCNSSNPYHPVTEDELALTVVDKRSCQKKWFLDYPWLTFCKVHERSNLHRDSIYVVNQQGKLSVREQLSLATRQQQEQRRQTLIIQISCIMFLLRQGLAFRGYSDENSNLIQLLKLRSIDNNFLKQWIDERKYLSHDIISELCKEIYLTIIRDIVKEISNRKWFSLICDESTLEQLCITIRSVDNNYNVFEDVIGLYEISRQNAPTIVETILDTLTRCGLDIANCRGQTYIILIDTEKLSRVIQSSSCCLQDVLSAAEIVINYFIRIRDGNRFNLFYNGVINDSGGLTEKPVLSRQRRPPKRYESNSGIPDFNTCEEFYYQQYTEALDIVVNMLHVRFTQSNFELLCDVEKFILNVSNNPVHDLDDLIQGIMEFCDGDIDIQRLKAE
ncbi:unnamed protein product, partial [Didymodactylos carnosus]